ncbi:hypothetical protein K8R32_00320, partial [bacterium]|nr:hypothetical protein [bacterium]
MAAVETIILEIKNHIGTDRPSSWYAGIAANPKNRLFVEHDVDEDNGAWIYNMANSNDEARRAEIYLIENVGFDGGPGGGDNTTKYVYAYKKTSYTKED